MTSITTLLKKNFDSELLFTDTESLTYEIKSESVYQEHKNLFDFSNFSKYSRFYYSQNEMVNGKMKFEYKGISINKFVGLKSKMHSMLSDDGKESNPAKGINNATEFKEFRETLINEKVIRHKMKKFKVKNINLEHTKSTKYHYHVLMMKDLL